MISYQGMLITTKSPPSYVRIWGESMAMQEFEDRRKVNMAADMIAEGHKFLQNQPIGFNLGDDPNKLEKKLKAHLKTTCSPQAYGFVFVPIVGWIFWEILGGVISWVIEKLLTLWSERK